MRTQYIVKESDTLKRKEFYDYIKRTYKLKKLYPYTKKKFITNVFPFVIDFEDKTFWICESITCNACAAQAGVMFTIDEFMKQVNN